MKKQLRRVLKDKTFCQISFHDGDTEQGFIIEVAAGSFNMITIDPIYPETAFQDEEGNVFVPGDRESAENSVNWIAVEKCFDPSFVCGVTFDVLHTHKSDRVKYINFIKEQMYMQTESKKSGKGGKAAPKTPAKPDKRKVNEPPKKKVKK